MSQTINPNMIITAREARGLTQTDLAEKLNTHKANISRFEKGDTAINTQTLLALAAATGYPPQFFYQSGDMTPFSPAWRMRRHVPAKIITPIQAQVNIIGQHLHLITTGLAKENPPLPLAKPSLTNTPQKIAARLRKKWDITQPVIVNMTALLEQQGIIISSFSFNTNRVDSRCILTAGKYPVILLNSNLHGDKQRFSLAYELGHLIMHAHPLATAQQDSNHQANLFAAEFLMPAKLIKDDFKEGISLPLLAQLKLKWKTSMISLLYRADDLALLTPNQKRYLLQQFNEQHIRRREPPQLDIPPEKPRRLQKILAAFMKKYNLNQAQLCTLLAIETPDYQEYYQ